MLRVACAVVVAAFAVLAVARAANSEPQARNGEVWVAFKGWGTVKLGQGLLEHRTVRCERQSCPAVNYLSRGSRAVLTAKPYAGWKFTHWHGACSGRRSRCSIDLSKVRPTAYGERHARVTATFIPVAQGITRTRPIPLRTTTSVGGGWRVRVNSVLPDVQLSQPPPTGAEDFAANVTIGYFGGAASTPANYLTWQAVGSHDTAYNPGSSPCPDSGPQPHLDTYDPVPSGQSVSGYVCWQIAANDAGSLELYFGSGSLNYPGTTWFALH
jgi:Divergent InlB B-repeat domain